MCNLKLIWKKNYDTKPKKEKSLFEFGGGGLGVLVFFFLFLFSFAPMVVSLERERERERGLLSLKKLNNFLLVVYIILMCCNVKIEHLIYGVL